MCITPFMETHIEFYNDIIHKVLIFYKSLRIDKLENNKGRKLALPIPNTIALAIFKQQTGIPTKKAIYCIFEPNCSYKTMVVNMNKFVVLAMRILLLILKNNQRQQHFVKHTDSTDIPVCKNKNAKNHKTMINLASWGHSGQGFFFGLKLHLTADLKHQVLSLRFSSGQVADQSMFMKLNQYLKGIFVADSAYISNKLAQEFFIEGERIILAKPRKNMKKLATQEQNQLYDTRMQIEINFKNLKCFYGLITSLPRSVNGFLANYIYSILAYLMSQCSLEFQVSELCS